MLILNASSLEVEIFIKDKQQITKRKGTGINAMEEKKNSAVEYGNVINFSWRYYYSCVTRISLTPIFPN